MKKTTRKRREEKSMETNCLTILALVTEMARRLNENISKVQLKPLDSVLASAAARSSALGTVDTSAA